MSLDTVPPTADPELARVGGTIDAAIAALTGSEASIPPETAELGIVTTLAALCQDARTDHRTSAAVRAACAHLSAGQVEDAFLALQGARDRLDVEQR